ncbi:MAG: ABC transporter permease [Blastocatellia bacterium]|nr:ABC transporter permease [Blastocatellia bacterium]
MFGRLKRAARALFRKDEVERDLDLELRFHLEMETRENIRRGMSEKEARREALLHFGGVERVKEECRDQRGVRFIETLWQDLCYGFRMLVKRPGFTVVALIVLALGIGANTSIFSVVYGVLLRPLPYSEGDRLIHIRQQQSLADVENMEFSVGEINDYRDRNQTLDALVEYHSMSFTLFGRGEPERVQTGVVSTNFFDVLGASPLLGRGFLLEDNAPGAEAVLVLSYGYWQRSFKGDPGVVGQVFEMNDRPHRVVGVLPAVPQYPDENDVYMPTSACPTRSSERFIASRNSRMMSVFGRLKPGVTVESAEEDIARVAAGFKNEHPECYPGNLGFAATAIPLREELTRRARPTLLILLGTVGLVLLIACANVANLTLARLISREREIAVRISCGAGRGRLIRQLLTESTMLALAGGALGLVVAAWGLDLLVAFAARFTTRAAEIQIDGSVLLFTLAVSIVTGVAFGLVPAFYSEKDLVASLKEGGCHLTGAASRKRMRSLLIVIQVAVSFVLLIGAGLMARSLIKLQQVDPGFNPERVLSMRITPNWSKYRKAQQYKDFFEELLKRVQSHPEVLSAAVASTYPLNRSAIENGPWNCGFQIEGRPSPKGELPPQADYRVVSTDYFRTLRMSMVRGRPFTDKDDANAPGVAIINESMARHHWGDEDPIGKRVFLEEGDGWLTIVGVVGNVKQYGLDSETTDELYRPFAQHTAGRGILVRTVAEPLDLARQMRDTVYDIDPETAVTEIQTLEEARSESLASPRLTTTLLGLFAMLALTITVAGISGVMALSVSQRTHEIGVRMALGASQKEILWMVMRQGMAMVLIGLALGIAGAFALSRFLTGMLFGIEPTDWITYIAVLLILIASAAVACFVPARRVTAIDPMTALRIE